MFLSKEETFVDINISSLYIYLAPEAISDRLVCDKPIDPNIQTIRHTYGEVPSYLKLLTGVSQYCRG